MKMVVNDGFTRDELNGADILRNAIPDIPDEFNTQFYLARWWRAYGGDLARIKMRLNELFTHRRLLGYDHIQTKHLQTALPIGEKTFERFCISSLADIPHAGNICVFFQRMIVNDIKEIVKVIPFSYVLHSYFILQEAFTRAQLSVEQEAGEPAAVIVILDLQDLNIGDFLNPLSISTRFARLIVKIWSDYFTETMIKLYLINSPALLSVMWHVTKLLMDKKTISRIEFLNDPTDLLKHLDPQLVPAIFGGHWRAEVGYAEKPELVCQQPVRVLPEHQFNADTLWRSYGYPNVPSTSAERVKGGQKLDISRLCAADGQVLVWHFTASSDVEFCIVRVEDNDDEAIVWPKVTLTSLRSPEQGHITCRRGKYKVRFSNPTNTWFPVQIRHAIKICSPIASAT